VILAFLSYNILWKASDIPHMPKSANIPLEALKTRGSAECNQNVSSEDLEKRRIASS
jgi:hypothetical protein